MEQHCQVTYFQTQCNLSFLQSILFDLVLGILYHQYEYSFSWHGLYRKIRTRRYSIRLLHQNLINNMWIFEIIVASCILIELIYVLVWLEKHQYIGWSYQHSIQHFAYLSVYLIWFILISIWWDMYTRWMFFVSIWTLLLLFHIYMERAWKFNIQ